MHHIHGHCIYGPTGMRTCTARHLHQSCKHVKSITGICFSNRHLGSFDHNPRITYLTSPLLHVVAGRRRSPLSLSPPSLPPSLSLSRSPSFLRKWAHANWPDVSRLLHRGTRAAHQPPPRPQPGRRRRQRGRTAFSRRSLSTSTSCPRSCYRPSRSARASPCW
jgi:hypothetical protein